MAPDRRNQGSSRRQNRAAPYPSAQPQPKRLQMKGLEQVVLQAQAALDKAKADLRKFCLEEGQSSALLAPEPGSEEGEIKEGSAPPRVGQSHRGGHNSGRGGRPYFPPKKDEKRIPVASDVLIQRIANFKGETATRYVNKSVGGGGAQFRIDNSEKGMLGCVTDGSIDRYVRSMKDEVQCSAVLFNLIPVLPERWALIEKDKSQSLDMLPTGRDPVTSKALGLFGGHVPLAVKRTVAPGACASCGGSDHELKHCIVNCPNGDIVGCPMCNTTEHLVDKCSQWAGMTDAQKVKILVTDRANRPSYRTSGDSWSLILHRYCMSSDFDANVLGKGKLPWSPGCAKNFFKMNGGKEIHNLQKSIDNGPEDFLPPPDSSNPNVLSIYKKDWKGKSLPWPSVLNVFDDALDGYFDALGDMEDLNMQES